MPETFTAATHLPPTAPPPPPPAAAHSRRRGLDYEQAFPQAFDFYEHGVIQQQKTLTAATAFSAPSPLSFRSRAASTLAPEAVVGWRFLVQGDLSALFFLFFPPQLDASLYAEVGNTLTSFWIRKILSLHPSDKAGGRARFKDLWLQPPEPITQQQSLRLQQRLTPQTTALCKTYVHESPLCAKHLLDFWMIELPTPDGGMTLA